MGNTLVSAQVLTVLGYFLGPLFPTIGYFLLPKGECLKWIFLILLIWLVLMAIIPAMTIREEPPKTATAVSASWSIWALVYLGFLIYATVRVFRDYTFTAGQVALKSAIPTTPLTSALSPP
jgi:hypothetical protein